MIDAACNALAAEFGLGLSRLAPAPTTQPTADTSAPTSTGSAPSSKLPLTPRKQELVLLKAAESLADYNVRLRSFLLRLCDPDDLGHSVSAEVRQLAAELATSNRYGKDRCDFHNPTTHDRKPKL